MTKIAPPSSLVAAALTLAALTPAALTLPALALAVPSPASGAAFTVQDDHQAMDHAAPGDGHDHAHDGETRAPQPPITPVASRTVTATVDGMVCDFCARSLTKVLKREDAVQDVSISLKDKTVTILLSEGATMSDEEVEAAVLSAGYNLASIERS